MVYGIIGLVIIGLFWFMIREMDKATPVCGSCKHYRKCYSKHPEYNKQNTLECPSCERFEVL